MRIWLKSALDFVRYGYVPEIGDRTFNKKFLNWAYEKIPLGAVVGSFGFHVSTKLQETEESKRAKVEMAWRAFSESVEKLYVCYADVCGLEWQVQRFDNLKKLRGSNSTRQTQKEFVHRSEIFAQQFYSTTSFFMKLLDCIGDRRFVSTQTTAPLINFLIKEYPKMRDDVEIFSKTMTKFAAEWSIIPTKMLHSIGTLWT